MSSAQHQPRAGTSQLPADTNLVRYFRELGDCPVLSRRDEIEAAQAVEAAEIAHWETLLSYRPAAPFVLAVVRDGIDRTSPEGLDASEVDRITALARHRCRSAPQAKRYRKLCRALATQIRQADPSRDWMTQAARVARELGQRPDPVADRTVVGGQPLPTLRVTEGYRRYLSRLERSDGAQRDAKHRFAQANLRLVIAIARGYHQTYLPLSDLIQEGNLGLLTAVERFDPSRGFRFSTYASWWIRHSINRGLAHKARVVRLPVQLLAAQRSIATAERKTLAKQGRHPTVSELARATGLPEEKVSRLRAEASTDAAWSLDQPVGDEDERPFVDFVEQPEAQSSAEVIDARRWEQAIGDLLATLRPREAAIIRWRFGLDGCRELTLKEIGAKFDLSRERIRQIQKDALTKMRRHAGRLAAL